MRVSVSQGVITALTLSPPSIRKADMLVDAQDSNADSKKIKKPRRSVQMWRKTIQYSNWAWIAAIVADVGIQAAKTADDPPSRIRMFSGSLRCPFQPVSAFQNRSR